MRTHLLNVPLKGKKKKNYKVWKKELEPEPRSLKAGFIKLILLVDFFSLSS